MNSYNSAKILLVDDNPNNLKINVEIPIKEDEIIPGYFRNTGNTKKEISNIYDVNFLDWTGKNKIDFENHFYAIDKTIVKCNPKSVATTAAISSKVG